MTMTLTQAVDKDFEITHELSIKALDAMLKGKIVNFKNGFKKGYQYSFSENLGKDFTIEAIENNGYLKLYSLKTKDVIYDVPIQQITITTKKACN